MSYGNYDGPNKADKGLEGGSCNRTRCQAPDAIWFNHGSHAWYCGDSDQIQFDPVNYADWEARHQPRCGHPMFETREMMEVSQADHQTVRPIIHEIIEIHSSDPDFNWPVWSDAAGPGRKARAQLAAGKVDAQVHTMTRQLRRQLARKGARA